MNRTKQRISTWGLTGFIVCMVAGGICFSFAGKSGPKPVPNAAFGPVQQSSAVYPPQSLPVRFDHQKHLARATTCTTCHQHIAVSTRATDSNFPPGKVCDTCHGAQHPRPTNEPARCELCHTHVQGERVLATILAPSPRLKFSHAGHLGAGIGCDRCHANVPKIGLATTRELPSELSCLGCHDGKQLPNTCETCHLQDITGRVPVDTQDRRRAPPILPRGSHDWGMTHDLAFVNNHRSVATARPDACRTCHEEQFCVECHSGATRPMQIHRGNFQRTHVFEARMNPQKCTACHQLQVDCQGCHERVGLGTGAASSGIFGIGSALSFHPAGFARREGHGVQAQRSMQSCASCHSEDTCLSCHASTNAAQGGAGVNPHGRGFAHSLRCKTLEEANRRVCLKCHEPGSARLSCQ